MDPPSQTDFAQLKVVGRHRIGDAGALVWMAEQLGAVALIDEACGSRQVAATTPSVGEMVVAVAIQRACQPGPKCELEDFLDACVPKVACLPAAAFSGQHFSRLAAGVTSRQLLQAQIALARSAVQRFRLTVDVLAFDTTNFDTFIATTTKAKLPQRGHAKSKRADLRVVGLAMLASETGHVPLLQHAYPGNWSDQRVLEKCLRSLKDLHLALADHPVQKARLQRTLVRDGGFWKEDLDDAVTEAGFGTIISLPMSHTAARQALEDASQRGAMQFLSGTLADVRAVRTSGSVGELKRTLVVVESKDLLEGQKRGIARALRKAKKELESLTERAKRGRTTKARLDELVTKALSREHLKEFVVARVTGTATAPRLHWKVDERRRQRFENLRLGKRVLCTDRHTWSTERIVAGFRGQWNVEELFRRAKKGGVVAWGPSYHWTDAALQLHTFATVLGLMLVSLLRIALGTRGSISAMMTMLAGIEGTLVQMPASGRGRPPTGMLLSKLSPQQRKAIRIFQIDRWHPNLS
jgi:transposase